MSFDRAIGVPVVVADEFAARGVAKTFLASSMSRKTITSHCQISRQQDKKEKNNGR
jgi:hypothetical protein